MKETKIKSNTYLKFIVKANPTIGRRCIFQFEWNRRRIALFQKINRKVSTSNWTHQLKRCIFRLT